MKTYKCDICNKNFKQKSHFDNHKKRKNPCSPNVCDSLQNSCKLVAQINETKEMANRTLIANENNDIKCQYCNRIFNHRCNLYVHLKSRCKIKKQMNDEREQIFQKLLEKMDMLEKSNDKILKENSKIQKENKKLRQKMKKIEIKKITYNNTNAINNGNIINNNIKLVAYGKEDRKTIDPDDILKAINGFGTNVALTKAIHFNDKYPEYHNIYINNMRDKYVMVYGEGSCARQIPVLDSLCELDWGLRLRNEIIDDIYATNKEYVEENLNEFVKKLDQSRIDSLKRWLATDTNDPDGPKIKKIKDELKMLLYNQKDIVLKQIAKPVVPLITEV